MMLTDADRCSSTWLKLQAHLLARIQILKTQLPELVLRGTPAQACAHAGKIAELEGLLADADPEQIEPEEDLLRRGVMG